MIQRYAVNSKGKLVKQAVIYTKDEHQIDLADIDNDAIAIITKLKKSGYNAYLVGGAVRDLLRGRKPKDFDIVTDAYPNRIRKLFWNSRIIGRRFKLVLIYFKNPDKMIEVSTYRSLKTMHASSNNIYGTMEEDVQRRDFTHNALYYSPLDEQIVDYVGGYKDIKKGVLRSIIPLKKVFKEDPVRMLRAVKYSIFTEAKMGFSLKRQIRKDASLIADCSVSRSLEELFKILASGSSSVILETCRQFGLLSNFVPGIGQVIERDKKVRAALMESLVRLDPAVRGDSDIGRGVMVYHLTIPVLRSLLPENLRSVDSLTLYRECTKGIKEMLLPLVAANSDITEAVRMFFKDEGLKLPFIPRKRRPFRRRSPKPVTGNVSPKERGNNV